MKTTLLFNKIAMLFSVFVFANTIYGQGASCGAATSLTMDAAPITGSITDATVNDPTAVACAGGAISKDGWYSFVATGTTATVRVSSTNRQLVLYAYSGTCGSLTQINCANVNTTAGAQIEIMNLTGLTATSTYYIRVVNSSANNMALDSVGVGVPATNNNCNFPVILTSDPTCIATTGTTAYATQSLLAYCAGTADDDVWYNFVATGTSHVVTVTPGTLDDAVIEVRTGTCTVTTNLACRDATSGSSAEVLSLTGLTIGTTYQIRVYSYGSGTGQGTFSICLTDPLPCIPSISSSSHPKSDLYISNIKFVGTLNDTNNTSTYNSSTYGYQDFTTLTNKGKQAKGEGVNIYVEGNKSAQIKAWVDWNKDGDFDDTTPDNEESVYDSDLISTISTTFGFTVPTNIATGNYRVRIRNYYWYNLSNAIKWGYDYNACEVFNETLFDYGEYGEAEDYILTVIDNCTATITTVTNGSRCNAGTVALSVTGSASATGYKWYDALTGGSLVATTVAANWTTPSLTTTTTYYVTATSATCESLVRTPIVATINPTPTVTFTPTAPVVCGDATPIQITAGGDKETVYLVNENFEAGTLGTFSNTNILSNGTTINNLSMWQNRAGVYIPSILAGYKVWFPAVASGFNSNKFAMSNSDVGQNGSAVPYTINSGLALTTAVSAANFTNLTLTFKMFYSHYSTDGTNSASDNVKVEVSTNGGGAWTPVDTIISDVGYGTGFVLKSYNLNSYVGQTNLKIRINYYAVWSDGVAVDDIKLFGDRPLNTAFSYDTTVVQAFTNVLCTAPYAYTSGSAATTIYIKPTLAQLQNASFSIPVSATLSNGCSASGTIVVTNNSKIWTAGTTGSWSDGTKWKPAGVPTIANCVIISDDSDINGTSYAASAKNLTVKNTGNLNLYTGNTLTVEDIVTVDTGGVFELENNSSLLQTNNITNVGDVTYKRDAASISGQDYVYWSSPVTGQALNTVYTTPTPGYRYYWDTLVNNNNGASGNTSQGNWVDATGVTMSKGTGYIMRGSSSFGMAPSTINAQFKGVPNNGTIPVTVRKGTYTGAAYAGANTVNITNEDDNWNLLGNPYPSAINALQFLSDNSANLVGNVRLWQHGFDIGNNANPFYNTFTYNYNLGDYTIINFSGATTPSVSDLIKSGQAFFAIMKDGVAASSATVNFTNSHRSASYANNSFFKSNQTVERNRIWLDFFNSTSSSPRNLVGYIQGATDGFDDFYDAKENIVTPIKMYSILDNSECLIQGKGLPFNDLDTIPLGFKADSNDNYTVAINFVDGLFDNQAIYLHDLQLNIVHDLKATPYIFNSLPGTFNNRFLLRFTNLLGTNNNVIEKEGVLVASNELITVKSFNSPIASIKVHNLLGQQLYAQKNINANEVGISKIIPTQSILLVTVTLENGYVKSTKIKY